MIYFDNSATTPVKKVATDEMYRVLTEGWGNPSAVHGKGREAFLELEKARKTVLSSLGLRNGGEYRLIFTGSGTESDNLAISGILYSKNFRFVPKIITSYGEHPAVARAIDEAEKRGFEVVRLSTKGGVINPNELEAALDERVVLVSVMRVSNETGAIYNIPDIFSLVKRKCPNSVTHCDAVQGYMKVNCNPQYLGADLLTVSGHKIGGPKGIGALCVNEKLIVSKRLCPIVFGGGQEGGFRSGTENMPGIVGMAAASRTHDIPAEQARVVELRELILSSLPCGVSHNKALGDCLPNIVSLCCVGVKSEVLVRRMSENGICISAGSACSSKKLKTNPSLLAFGLSPNEADSTVRISLSADNTEEECRIFLSALEDAVKSLIKKH